MNTMIYKWRDGFHKSGDPQIVGEALELVRKSRGLTAPNVVDAMQQPGSPLRPYFTLDIHRAAEERWLDQAHELIRALAVVIDEPNASAVLTAYAAIGSADAKYVPTLEALSQKASRDLLLATVAKRLSDLADQYEHLKEFATVWSAIRRSVARKSARARKRRASASQSKRTTKATAKRKR